MKLIYIDLFCGAGGTTTGIEEANIRGEKCATVVACVNHDPNAIASHAANHPKAVHYTEDIRTLDTTPLKAILQSSKKKYPEAKTVLWASCECTNFSKAKGGMPRDADSRTLAEHLYRYIETLNPDYIQIENVEEFMSWGKLNEKGKPVSWHKGCDYLKWVDTICQYGYSYDWRILNAADYGAYTSRKRYFGLFTKHGLKHAFPVADYSKRTNTDNLFGIHYKKWKPVKEVLDLEDEGESIFTRKKPLVENTLKRIYAGLVKFVAGGEKSFLVKWNSMGSDGHYAAPSVDEPCPTVTVQNRLGVAKCRFLSKQFSGHDESKNISVEGPAGTITCRDHHALITYYGNGKALDIEGPAPTITTKDRIGKITFIANEYGNSGSGNSIENVCPSVMPSPKQKLVSCFLFNPQYKNIGRSIEDPCFTLIARMDKTPPYLVTTETGIGISIYEDDSHMTVKIKEFMAMYGIIDIKMRMLKITELKSIMGFPKDYVLVGSQAEQKKYIGNAVEVNMSRRLCEALAEVIETETVRHAAAQSLRREA